MVVDEDNLNIPDFFNINSNIKSSSVKTFDFGLNVGVNYELENGLNISSRYNFGLIDVAGNSKNSIFSAGVGYTF